MNKKLFYFVTEDWYFLSHRLPMAKAAQQAGFDVTLITNISTKKEPIEAAGIRVIPFALKRKSLNPITAIRQIVDLTKIYKEQKPDLVHHIAMKPILFGSIAAWVAKVPHVLNAFAGLGVIFETNILLARILRPFLMVFFFVLLRRKGSWTLFQNRDDRNKLIGFEICDPDRCVIIRGSGVDVDAYNVTTIPPDPPFVCVMAGRMIEAKGLSVLKEAFDIIRVKFPNINLWLCGQPDPANPGSWNAAQLNAWCNENPHVIWKGQQSDMAAIWAQAHIAVQPSLGGEGLPKSLLEAAACGRAIIASDAPGCREVVEQGRNGYLVPVGDAKELAEKIMLIVEDLNACTMMGLESRKIVEGDLSAASVTEQTRRLYESMVS